MSCPHSMKYEVTCSQCLRPRVRRIAPGEHTSEEDLAKAAQRASGRRGQYARRSKARANNEPIDAIEAA